MASVDVSDCGMISIHVGAFTLRLTREALCQLNQTLTQAALQFTDREPPTPDLPVAFMRPERGDA